MLMPLAAAEMFDHLDALDAHFAACAAGADPSVGRPPGRAWGVGCFRPEFRSLLLAGAVRLRMTAIQNTIDDGKYDDEEVISVDETGVFFGAPPKNQYIPPSAARATAPDSDEKARFTSMLWGKRNGKMGPSYNIIKMSVKGVDLSTSRVLNNLHKIVGFRTQDGWNHGLWEQTLTLNVKGKTTTQLHRRPYLIHTESMVVITVQIRAWMDTVGLCMWIELQLGPYSTRFPWLRW
jgi:hypothetical protein